MTDTLRTAAGWAGLVLVLAACAAAVWNGREKPRPPNRKIRPVLRVIERGGCNHVEYVEEMTP